MTPAQKHNQELKDKQQPEKFGWTFERSMGYKCVVCGKELSPAEVRHQNYEVLVAKCIYHQYNN